MNILKVFVIAVAFVLAAFVAMWLVGVAITLLKAVFWLAVICIVVMLLWKMFGPKGGALVQGGDAQNKIDNAEMALDEYKRKLEDQVRQDSDAHRR